MSTAKKIVDALNRSGIKPTVISKPDLVGDMIQNFPIIETKILFVRIELRRAFGLPFNKNALLLHFTIDIVAYVDLRLKESGLQKVVGAQISVENELTSKRNFVAFLSQHQLLEIFSDWQNNKSSFLAFSPIHSDGRSFHFSWRSPSGLVNGRMTGDGNIPEPSKPKTQMVTRKTIASGSMVQENGEEVKVAMVAEFTFNSAGDKITQKEIRLVPVSASNMGTCSFVVYAPKSNSLKLLTTNKGKEQSLGNVLRKV